LVTKKKSSTVFLFVNSALTFHNSSGTVREIFLFPFKKAVNQTLPPIFVFLQGCFKPHFSTKMNAALRTWYGVQPKPLLARYISLEILF
jgi:hypothetical protein